MADKNLFINDLIHRNPSHTFIETVINSLIKVEFVNASSVVVGESTNLDVIDAYRTIRDDSLAEETPAFISTSTQRDALVGVDQGTQIFNITTGNNEVFNGTIWVSVAEESNSNNITASTTQTQGNGLLTTTMNFVAVTANDDDTVTLPSVSRGISVTIINDGDNLLQIFPNTGDDLGNGVNVSMQLETKQEITFWGVDTTVWHIRSLTERFHAEMHDEDNADEFVINAVGEEHLYHTNGIVAGDLAEWTFDIGGAGTSFPIASIADAGGGDITVTTTGSHGLAIDDIVSQTNLADAAYVGVFKVLTVPTVTTFTVTAVFTATGTGTMDQPATLTCNPIAAGAYAVDYSLSATTSTNNETFDFEIYNDTVQILGTKRTSKFGIGGDFRTVAGCGLTKVVANGKISLALDNEDSAANFTIEDFTVRLIKL